MSNKKYDIFKIIVLIVYPALTACVATILQALNFSETDVVITIMTAIQVMFGTIIRQISSNYHKNQGEGFEELEEEGEE